MNNNNNNNNNNSPAKKSQNKFYCNQQKTIDAYAYEQQPLTANYIRIPPQGWIRPAQYEDFETDDEMVERIRVCPPKYQNEKDAKKKKTATCRCAIM